MSTVTIDQIDERLRELPPEKLGVVYDFVSYLAEREAGSPQPETLSESAQLMLASEAILSQDWDRPEEDAAWANL
jgi:hypothetical protein